VGLSVLMNSFRKWENRILRNMFGPISHPREV
jgi:hypothetical protein